MSEQKPRLNLIQRAMQRGALSRGTVVADEGLLKIVDDRSLKEANALPQSVFSEEKRASGAPCMPRLEAELTQIVKEAEPVRLDYAKLRASRIVTPDNKSSATYNEFRSLKRKLIPMTRDPETGVMARNVVMVTSALPGEGKTFTVMNLAISLAAESNFNVILVDGDVVQGSISNYFQGDVEDGLVDLLTKKRQRVEDILHPCADLPGLHVLFAGKRNEAAPELLASRRMADISAALSKHFQESIVLFDAPPVLAASEPTAMAAHAHHLIMLIASGRASRHQVEAALTEVSSCSSISLLFNRSPQWERPLAGPYYYYGQNESQEA